MVFGVSLGFADDPKDDWKENAGVVEVVSGLEDEAPKLNVPAGLGDENPDVKLGWAGAETLNIPAFAVPAMGGPSGEVCMDSDGLLPWSVVAGVPNMLVPPWEKIVLAVDCPKA